MPVRRPRIAALVLATLFIAGQAALFTHQLFVPHQVCPEHGGELIHVDAARAAPSTGAAPAVANAQLPAGEHGHEHCTVFAGRREDALRPPATVWVEPGLPRAVTAPTPSAVRSTSRAVLLRLAPKNSPPV